jgi:hypothetical protein
MSQKFPSAKTKGIDFSKSGIESAKSKFKGIENLSFDCADANDTKIWSQKYDIVTAFEVLEHIEDYQSVLTSMINVSNKYIILSFPTGRMRKYEHKIGHVRNFKYKEVENFISRNFNNVKPIRVYYAGFPFYSPISRDLINYMYGFYNSRILNERRSLWKICYEQIFFILFKYFSTKKRWGDQFIGIFEKR